MERTPFGNRELTRELGRGETGFGLHILSGCQVEAGLDGERLEAGRSVGRLQFTAEVGTRGLW